MNIQATSKSRTERIIKAALNLWSKYNLNELRNRMDEIWGDKFLPLHDYSDAPLSCAIFGSGSFSTGRFELYCAELIKKELGWSPVRYTLILTNKRKSRAREVADRFRLPIVELDFNTWYRQNYDPYSKNPIRDTSLFRDPEYPPSHEARFDIRADFDSALLNRIKKATLLPDMISLRGYNFPIIYSLLVDKTPLIDDTHPADLSITDKNGVPLCPGWQAGATQKMRDSGTDVFRSSLIEVKPFSSSSDAKSLDTGLLFALTPGIRPPTSWKTKTIQETMKRTEDYVLCALKASGIFPYLWGVSKENLEVEYKAEDGQIIKKLKPAFMVGDRLRCGRNAFGRDKEDLSLSI